jgi:3'-phosphoadenosine 5'-phosphosulfate sulfotransferase (PAPS reductase)/FAD synthetase
MKAISRELKYLQFLPLSEKIKISQIRIKEWYEYWGGQVYVSFSGGKDSTVLLHLVRELYPEVPAVFCDTGLEFPEIKQFVRQQENVTIIRPKMSYKQVIEKYGWPVVSKANAKKIWEIRHTKTKKMLAIRLYGRKDINLGKKHNGKLPEKWRFLLNAPFEISDKCCNIMKKQPFKKYTKDTGKRGFIGIMADDSGLRRQSYLKYGCNAFGLKDPISRPIIFWGGQDIWKYIQINKILFCEVYNMGYKTTGCIYCAFGAHLEKPGEQRFIKLEQIHPKLYSYCMNKLGMREVLEYCNIPYNRKGFDFLK